MIKTRATMLVLHRITQRAFTYNGGYELLEPLILEAREPRRYSSIRCFWKPMCSVPAWAAGIRDTEFDTYFL